jgi:hypothetical protein
MKADRLPPLLTQQPVKKDGLWLPLRPKSLGDSDTEKIMDPPRQ